MTANIEIDGTGPINMTQNAISSKEAESLLYNITMGCFSQIRIGKDLIISPVTAKYVNVTLNCDLVKMHSKMNISAIKIQDGWFCVGDLRIKIGDE